MDNKVRKINQIQKKVAKEKQKIEKIDDEDKTKVNKQLLSNLSNCLQQAIEELKTLNIQDDKNFEKAMQSFETTIASINELMNKDNVTNRERRHYINVIDKHLETIKQLAIMNHESKQKEKVFWHHIVDVGAVTAAVGTIVAITGKVAIGVIKAIKK